MRVSRESGQTAVEYLLIVSVASLSLVGASYSFYPEFRDGVASLAADVQEMLETHELPSFGTSLDSGVVPEPPAPADAAGEDGDEAPSTGFEPSFDPSEFENCSRGVCLGGVNTVPNQDMTDTTPDVDGNGSPGLPFGPGRGLPGPVVVPGIDPVVRS